jgi:hypothetical protein
MIRSLLSIFHLPTPLSGFGVAGINRQRETGAILIYGDWQGQRGVEFDEDGMSISRCVTRYYLAVNDKMLSNVGEPRARARSDKFSRDIEIEGEMTGSNYPSSVATAIELANDMDDFGDGSGDILLDEGTVTQERGGWRMLNIKLSSDPGVVAT